MSSLNDQWNLATSARDFLQRMQAGLVVIAQNVQSEVIQDQQTITMGAVTAGTFTLTYGGNTTAALQWNSSALAIQTALNALASITAAGGVECTGGPLPTTGVVVNFLGNGAFPAMTHTDTLTGGVATITHTTVGTWVLGHTKRSALASKILANPSGYAALMALGVAAGATVQTDFPAPNYTQSNGVTAAQADTDIQNQISAVFNSYF